MYIHTYIHMYIYLYVCAHKIYTNMHKYVCTNAPHVSPYILHTPHTYTHTFCTHHTHIHIYIVYITHVHTYVHTTHICTLSPARPPTSYTHHTHIIHTSYTHHTLAQSTVKSRLYLNPPLRSKKTCSTCRHILLHTAISSLEF